MYRSISGAPGQGPELVMGQWVVQASNGAMALRKLTLAGAGHDCWWRRETNLT